MKSQYTIHVNWGREKKTYMTHPRKPATTLTFLVLAELIVMRRIELEEEVDPEEIDWCFQPHEVENEMGELDYSRILKAFSSHMKGYETHVQHHVYHPYNTMPSLHI